MSELLLKQAEASMGQAPISHIKANLDRLFGKGVWVDWEPETLSIELGLIMDDLLLEKLTVLKILEQEPDLFFDDVTFMLHATEVINNHVADFETVPMPTSLELAFAISEVKKIRQANDLPVTFPLSFTAAIAYLLRQEGYSKPIEPFDFVPEAMLEHGQTPADTEAKKKAIKTYIEHMESL